MNKEIKFAFFGSSEFSVIVLKTLKEKGLVPSLVVTVPDKPRGRKMIVTPEEVKVWAQEENVPCLQFKTLKSGDVEKSIMSYFPNGVDVFIVTHYGKMIPNNILDLPKYKTLNIHPSLLPKLRGPSPIISAILRENETGVTIIRLDEEMDHGPILKKQKADVFEWPPYEEDLKKILATLGANMLAEILEDWIAGKISEQEQNHEEATVCEKIQKTDGELSLFDPANLNLRKIRAFHKWPTAYFFQKNGDKKIRVIIKKANIENNELIIDRVVPEGKKEMNYKDFLKGIKTS